MRRLAAALFSVFILAGCQDDAPTDPGVTRRLDMASSSHAGKYFSFLNPVPPGPPPPAGTFHPYAAPLLKICRIVQNGCETVAISTLDTQTTNGLGLITRDGANGYYEAIWQNLHQLPRGAYQLTVAAWPLSAQHQPMLILGDMVVNLVSGGGAGLDISDNSVPIRFSILVGAFCEFEGCTEVAFDNEAGGEFILEEEDRIGKFGIEFEPGFLCGPNQTNCEDGSVVLTIERYSGPERCIPVGYAAIQWESCISIRAEPFGVKVSGVTVGACLEPRADTYANSGHLRLLKVSRDAAGAVMPGTVTDLNANVGGSFIFECADEFDAGGLGLSPAGSDALHRLAVAAGRALKPIVRLLAPRPAYARHKGPFIASLEDFSRIGPVLPVVASFDRNNAVGQPGVALSPDVAPRARVQATRIPGTTNADYFIAGLRGVQHVAVTFTPTGGTAHTTYTDADGYASATWVLGPVASNPQTLLAEVGYPVPSQDPDADDFPNFAAPWASNLFTAYAQEFKVFFLSPLGSSSGGAPNVTNVAPTVRVCGPLANGSTNEPGQTCPGALTLPAPALAKNGSSWSTAWKTDKNTVNNSLYRIEVLVNGAPTGGFLLRRGGGGGSDPAGTYQFQTGSNLPVKFTIER